MKQRHDGGYVTPNNQRIYSMAMGQPPSDVAYALCGWGAWTPPRLLQRPRRGKMWYQGRGARPRLRVMELTPVVPPSDGPSSAFAVEHHRPSISVVDCRTRPSHGTRGPSHGTRGGQFATIPPPPPLFPDDRSHLRCLPHQYYLADGRALPQRRFRELRSVPRARLLGGWRS